MLYNVTFLFAYTIAYLKHEEEENRREKQRPMPRVALYHAHCRAS